MPISQERIEEIRKLPDREILEEVLHIAGFKKMPPLAPYHKRAGIQSRR